MLTLILVSLITGFAAGLILPLIACLLASLRREALVAREQRHWLARHRAIR